MNDIFAPPVVRLLALYARLGDWKRVRTWRLENIAERPALGRWFASLPSCRPRLTSLRDSGPVGLRRSPANEPVFP